MMLILTMRTAPHPITFVAGRDMNRTLQDTVAGFVKEHKLEAGVAYRLLDLVSEIGEISKELLKSTEYGRVGFQGGHEWEEELGDALFSLTCVANATDVDLEEALLKALVKYQKRIESREDVGSGR